MSIFRNVYPERPISVLLFSLQEKVNVEKEIEKHRNLPYSSHLENDGHLQNA